MWDDHDDDHDDEDVPDQDDDHDNENVDGDHHDVLDDDDYDWGDENIEDTDHNDGQLRPIDQHCQLQRERDQSLKVNQHQEGIIKRRGNILHYYVFLVSDWN